MTAPLGEEVLAAVTTGSLNILCVFVLPMGTCFIIQSFASQLRGRGDIESLPRYAYYALGLALLAGLCALCALPFVRPFVGSMQYAQGVQVVMVEYVTIRLLSIAPAIGIEALGSWYGGLGNTRPALVSGVVAMVVNVALNYLLIEPRFGLPGYGARGAAFASVLASTTGFAVILGAFLLGFGRERAPLKTRLKWHEFVRVLRFGLPNGVNWFLEFAAFVMFTNWMVGHLGTTVLAAFNVVMQINSISFMPAFGIASAGAILVGEAIGRGKHDEVVKLVRLTGKVSGLWMGSVGLVYIAIPDLLIGLFESGSDNSDALLAVGATMLGLSAIWQVFDAANMTLSESLRAAGDTTWGMGARLFLAWVVFMPLSWAAIFVWDGGVFALMASLVGYLALLAAAFGYRFASGRWRDIELVGEPAVLESS
jgi:MATE family multidrug resistance protein